MKYFASAEVSRKDKQQIIDVCDGTSYVCFILTLWVCDSDTQGGLHSSLVSY